ncbi:MAG: hypothetical protein JW725_01260 [Candidatus Babeliaceae bacterium]|nr:hypothetical protein [Candidatus Babeliaceae bacterium]
MKKLFALLLVASFAFCGVASGMETGENNKEKSTAAKTIALSAIGGVLALAQLVGPSLMYHFLTRNIKFNPILKNLALVGTLTASSILSEVVARLEIIILPTKIAVPLSVAAAGCSTAAVLGHAGYHGICDLITISRLCNNYSKTL